MIRPLLLLCLSTASNAQSVVAYPAYPLPGAKVFSIADRKLDVAEERKSNGTYPPGYVYIGSSDIEMCFDMGTVTHTDIEGEQVGALRIPSITMNASDLAGQEARLLFKYEDLSGSNPGANASAAITVRITAELNAFPAAFNSRTSFGVTKRKRTKTYIDWAMTQTYTDGQYVTTPDLRDVVSEVLTLGGWENGNSSLLFIFERASGNGTRTFDTNDAKYNDGSKLDANYGEGRTVLPALVIQPSPSPAAPPPVPSLPPAPPPDCGECDVFVNNADARMPFMCHKAQTMQQKYPAVASTTQTTCMPVGHSAEKIYCPSDFVLCYTRKSPPPPPAPPSSPAPPACKDKKKPKKCAKKKKRGKCSKKQLKKKCAATCCACQQKC